MDADEALARQLQAEEHAAATAQQRAAAAAAAAQHHLRGGGAGQARFARLVEDAARKARRYEDELAQALALSVMPFEQLVSAAREACTVSADMGEQPPLAQDDALAHELLAWFKRDFFTWVNRPACATCCCDQTHMHGTVLPSAEEAAHQAGRTEVYRCSQCSMTTRFPRYNDPVKLLETRQGRCGEWANCFTLCCRAAGLDVRLAVDWEDHVWTEHWSQTQSKWVHLDPCEAAYDKPLLYEAGWGKKLSYVVAVGRDGAMDVTRRYTRKYAEVQTRRGLVSESWLADYLRQLSVRLRADLAPAQRQALEARDAADQQLLLHNGSQPLSAAELALPGRQTGDASWLAGRGEDGSGGAAAAAAAQHPAATATGAAAAGGGGGCTRYQPARDVHLRQSHPHRLCGGAARASGENGPAEVAAAAFDGSTRTKWLDFGGRGRNASWLEYRLPEGQPAAVLGSYALTSADDSPERDPRHVVLEAWSEGGACWVTLDEQPSLHFTRRHHRLELPIRSSTQMGLDAGPSRNAAAPAAAAAAPDAAAATAVAAPRGAATAAGAAPASRRFRLRVVSVANPAAANSVQLAGLDLYAQPPKQQQQQQEQQQRGAVLCGQGQQHQQEQQQGEAALRGLEEQGAQQAGQWQQQPQEQQQGEAAMCGQEGQQAGQGPHMQHTQLAGTAIAAEGGEQQQQQQRRQQEQQQPAVQQAAPLP